MTPLSAQKPRVDRGFERIYRRHLGDVYRYAFAVLRNAADAEDVTQTTFLNAYRAYERGERPRNAQNWLIAIAHNVCRQRFRQEQRRPDEIAYDDGVGELVPEDDEGPTAEDIQRALGHLAFNQRAALVMRELEGRSYAEIGEVLGLSVSAVETLIFRARRSLREQLDGSLTCAEAERAISLQLDRKLPRAERGPLRAHLRECADCERLARSQRAQRGAFKALGAVPIPASLTSLFGGGSGGVGAALGAKAAAVAAAGAVATGIGVEGSRVLEPAPERAAVAAAEPAAVVSATPAATHVPLHAVERSTAAGAVTRARAARSETSAAPGQAKRGARPSTPGRARTPQGSAVSASALAPGRVKTSSRVKPKHAATRGTAATRSKPKVDPPRRSAPKAERPARVQTARKSPKPAKPVELPAPVPIP